MCNCKYCCALTIFLLSCAFHEGVEAIYLIDWISCSKSISHDQNDVFDLLFFAKTCSCLLLFLIAHSEQTIVTIGLNGEWSFVCFTTMAWFNCRIRSSSASCCSLHGSHLAVLSWFRPWVDIHLENYNVDFLVLQPLQNHMPCDDRSQQALHFPRVSFCRACSHSPLEKYVLYLATWQLMHVLVSKQPRHTRVWIELWCCCSGKKASAQNHS